MSLSASFFLAIIALLLAVADAVTNKIPMWIPVLLLSLAIILVGR